MTVAELIEKLKILDPSMVVKVGIDHTSVLAYDVEVNSYSNFVIIGD